MNNNRYKFEGQMIQFQKDMTERMDRVETKLDNMIDKNIVISALTSIVVAVISVIGFGGIKR